MIYVTIFPGMTSPCCSGRDACQKILIKSLKETIVDGAQGISYPFKTYELQKSTQN